MSPPNLFEASSREELLDLCQKSLGDNQAPLLKRSFKDVGLSGAEIERDDKIRFMQWNTLADALCTGTENFIRCPKQALQWQVRNLHCLEEILTYDPDIVCLQEVDHYADFYNPLLTQAGYVGTFNPKPDSPCLDCVYNNGPDGCAVFFKKDKFELVKKEVPVLEVLQHDRSFPTNQVAVVVKLKCNSLSLSNKTFLVATTHLKAKKGYEKLRHGQGSNLLDVIGGMADGCPVVVGGDFNAESKEKVYTAFMESGLGFESAYKLLDDPQDSEPAFTTWKIRPQGEFCHTIDYVWYSKNMIQPVALLKFPTEEEIGADRLPSWHYPSDHLSLVCDFIFK